QPAAGRCRARAKLGRMNTAAWVVQGVLAAMFFGVGLAKVTQTRQQLQALSPNLAWTEDFGATTVKLIGAAEVLGGLGLILPMLTGIAELLTPIAAAGPVVVMSGAGVAHARRTELTATAPPLARAIGAGFVAGGRFGLRCSLRFASTAVAWRDSSARFGSMSIFSIPGPAPSWSCTFPNGSATVL